VREGDDYVLTGTKAWITHGGVADFYTVLARTSAERSRGITALLVPGDAPGLSAARPERKMGFTASTTAQVLLDGVRVPQGRRIGAQGEGFGIALAALDSGRLGIAACAVGLARAALEAVLAGGADPAGGFGLGVSQAADFRLADLATQVEAGRALYLAAARRRDAGRPFSQQAAMAKLFCTDMVMRVTTEAVQLLGPAGALADGPAERYLREAKMFQIVEGTNQIQRVVISRNLTKARKVSAAAGG
jgi:alkylation response protein AidB-like acyl-CoA dehydrogenase